MDEDGPLLVPILLAAAVGVLKTLVTLVLYMIWIPFLFRVVLYLL
jgi:hypothetical protein